MPSLKEIRNRIRSVKNTQKITRAMKLVAAAKLRRAQDAVVASRPYARKMREMLAAMASSLDEGTHPLFRQNTEPGRVLLIPISSDRGLCGGFNSSIIKRTERERVELAKVSTGVELAPIGRKARGHFQRRDVPSYLPMDELLPDHSPESVQATVRRLVDLFESGEFDQIHLVYNEFQSALTQVVRVETFLPLSAEGLMGDEDRERYSQQADILFEPPVQELLDELLPRYLESQFYRALLESLAGH